MEGGREWERRGLDGGKRKQQNVAEGDGADGPGARFKTGRIKERGLQTGRPKTRENPERGSQRGREGKRVGP